MTWSQCESIAVVDNSSVLPFMKTTTQLILVAITMIHGTLDQTVHKATILRSDNVEVLCLYIPCISSRAMLQTSRILGSSLPFLNLFTHSSTSRPSPTTPPPIPAPPAGSTSLCRHHATAFVRSLPLSTHALLNIPGCGSQS